MSIADTPDDGDTGFGVVHRSLRGRLTSHEIAVYVALSWRANGEGKCWPRHTVLAEDAGCAVSTVKKALDGLRDAGEVTWEPRVNEDGSTGSNLYTVTRLAGVPPQPPHGGGVAATRLGGSRVAATERDTGNETQGRTPPPQASGGGPVLALVASGDAPEPALFASDEVEKPATPEDTWPAEATIAGCQRAWTEGYEETRSPAHPGIRVPAMKAIKDLAKTCETLGHWRALWEASRDAGRAGRYAVRDYLGGPPVSRFTPRSSNVHATAASLALLDEMMHPERRRPATGGTR